MRRLLSVDLVRSPWSHHLIASVKRSRSCLYHLLMSFCFDVVLVAYTYVFCLGFRMHFLRVFLARGRGGGGAAGGAGGGRGARRGRGGAGRGGRGRRAA